MEERNFYKSGKISDYLYLKEQRKGRAEYGRTDKSERPCDKAGKLRGL